MQLNASTKLIRMSARIRRQVCQVYRRYAENGLNMIGEQDTTSRFKSDIQDKALQLKNPPKCLCRKRFRTTREERRDHKPPIRATLRVLSRV